MGEGGLSIFSASGSPSPCEGADQLVMDDLDDLLAGGDGSGDGLTGGAGLDPFDKVLHDGQRDVGLQKRHTDLAQRGLDVGLRQRALFGQAVEDTAKAF